MLMKQSKMHSQVTLISSLNKEVLNSYIPFIYFWGYEVQIIYIFVSHFIIDLIKSRYKKIIDVQDQSLHYVTLALIEMISPL